MMPMADQTQSPTPYPVSVWEGIAIALGAIALGITALIGLGAKAARNTLDPQRAEAIARSLMEYEIPGGSHGVVGINIGGLKAAVIHSSSYGPGLARDGKQGDYKPPEVELLIAEDPVVKDQNNKNDSGEISKENLSSLYAPPSGLALSCSC